MNLDKFDNRHKLVQDLCKQSSEIHEAVMDSVDVEIVKSWFAPGDVAIVLERLVALDEFLRVECCFGAALENMSDMITSDEEEKWIFPVDKKFNFFIKDILIRHIEDTLYFARTNDFYDYRSQNLAGEVTRKLGELRDWYKEHYELND